MDTVGVLKSLGLFIVAAVCEIGGGWLIWKWLRDDRPGWWGLAGALVLVLYGIIPTLQASHFGRVYAVYGGFFIVMSLFWGWYFDGNRPDWPDVLGGAIALVGVCVMMYWPRAILPAESPDVSAREHFGRANGILSPVKPSKDEVAAIAIRNQGVPELIRFRCTNCGQKEGCTNIQNVGKKVRCPSCQQVFPVLASFPHSVQSTS